MTAFCNVNRLQGGESRVRVQEIAEKVGLHAWVYPSDRDPQYGVISTEPLPKYRCGVRGANDGRCPATA
jgi:hypothetical protein